MQREIKELHKQLGIKYNLPDYVIEEITKIVFKRLIQSNQNHEDIVLHLMGFGKFAPKPSTVLKRRLENDKNTSETLSD